MLEMDLVHIFHFKKPKFNVQLRAGIIVIIIEKIYIPRD